MEWQGDRRGCGSRDGSQIQTGAQHCGSVLPLRRVSGGAVTLLEG